MNETLKPCPFCGGEVELTTYRDEGYQIECHNHEWPKHKSWWEQHEANELAADVMMCSWGLGDEAKAVLIEAWNTRIANGECELEIKDNMNESEGTGAVWWECSSCHWQIEFFHTKWLEHAKFCPECGRKIRKAVKQ